MAEVLEQLDLNIDHLDFDHTVGHIWRKKDRYIPTAVSYCGIGKTMHGHDPYKCAGQTIPFGSTYCPHCGVPICEKCRELANYDKFKRRS